MPEVLGGSYPAGMAFVCLLLASFGAAAVSASAAAETRLSLEAFPQLGSWAILSWPARSAKCACRGSTTAETPRGEATVANNIIIGETANTVIINDPVIGD